MPIEHDTDVQADDGAGEQEQRRPAPTGLTRDEFHAKDKAAFLAGADDALAEPADKPVTKPAKVIGAPVDDDDDDQVVEDDDADAEPAVVAEPDDDEDEDDTDTDTDDDEPADTVADPELAKRLAAVRKTEQRQRQALAAERAAFERERTEWKAQSKELTEAKQSFDKLVANVKYDSYSVLRALGVSDDDMELHAQHLYSRSKSAAVKPEHRAASDREMRLRAATDKAEAAEAKAAKLEQDMIERDRKAAAAREGEVYLRRVVRKVDDTTPHAKRMIEQNPKKAAAALTDHALELAQKLGSLPKAAKVLAAYERRLVRERRELGIDPLPAAAPAAKVTGGIGTKTNPIKAKPAAAPAAASGINGAVVIPSRAEMIKELEELQES